MDREPGTYVHVKNISIDSDYWRLHSQFSEYGRIQKLFYKSGASYANIYYETVEEVLAVIEASRYKSWIAERGRHQLRSPGNRIRDKSPYPRKSFSSPHDHTSEHSNFPKPPPSESNMSDDLEVELVNQVYVDVHGNELNVCRLKDGEFLVPLTEIRRSGFNIFKKENYDALLVEDEQITRELYLHLLAEAKSFLIKNKINDIDENKITDVIQRVRSQLLDTRPYDNRRSFTGSTKSLNSDCGTPCEKNTPINSERKRYSNDSSGKNNSYRQQNGEFRNSNGHLHSSSPKQQSTNRPSQYNDDAQNQCSNDTSPFTKTRVCQNTGQNITITSTFGNLKSADPKKAEVPSDETNTKTELHRPRSIPTLTVDAPQHPPPVRTELRKPRDNLLQKSPPSEPVVTAVEKPLNQITLQPEFQLVKISHVESPTCCWVSLAANSDCVDSIILDVADAEDSCKVIEPVVGDLVIAEYEEVWSRARVVQTSPLKVIFIDYGNTEQVNIVKHMPNALVETPAQAVKVEFDDVAGKKLTLDMECRIRAVKKNSNCYLVSFDEKTATPVKKQPSEYYGKPNPVAALKDKDIVMIVGEADGQLFVRTKECYLKFKEIIEKVKIYSDAGLEILPSVKCGQIILATNANVIRRAIVQKVGATVSIEYLDYPGGAAISLDNIKAINEDLAKQPITFVLTPPLDGVTKFGDEASAFLFEFFEKKSKFNVVLNDEHFDLIIPTSQESLSSKIKKLNGDAVKEVTKVVNDIIKYENMQYHELKMGIGSFIFFSVTGADDMTVIPTDGVTQHMTKLADIQDVDENAYKPQKLEMCLGLYEECWYRCVVQEVNEDGSYDVMFVDYGNQAKLTSDVLRRLSRELADIPVIGNLCVLDDVPHEVKNIDAKIRQLLTEGEIYEAEVLDFDGLKYKIRVPTVTDKLKAAQLI